MVKTKIAVLVSGGGTNLQALLDAQQSGALTAGEIVLVIASNDKAYALTRAANAGVPAVVCSRKALGSQAAFEAAISQALAEHGAELIVMAGFMSILTENFTSQWPRRILNIHPSLIPLQQAVDVVPGDTPEVLQRRVMEQAEWKLLPQAAQMISEEIGREKAE